MVGCLTSSCDPKSNEQRGTSSVATPFAGPSLKVPFLSSSEVALDGILSEEAWARAAHTGKFVGARSGAPDPGRLQGHARLFMDNEFLYVAFEVEDPTVRGGFPANAIDPHLWERDTVEIMIDPEGADNRDYFEIQINPQSLVFDSRFDDYNAPRGGPAGPFGHEDWSSKVERSISISGTLDDPNDVDQGYTVEARIPWSALGRTPKPGDTWKMNFYAMQDNGGVAWSPILGQGNFHTVKYFGDVTFEGRSP